MLTARRALEIAHQYGLRARDISREDLDYARSLEGKVITDIYGVTRTLRAAIQFDKFMANIAHESYCETREAARCDDRD